MRILTTISCFFAALCASPATENPALRIEWRDNILTISGPKLPGEKIDTLYLEACCRKGSTHRKWEETVIPHTTRLVSANADKTRIELESVVDGGVTVTHDIQARGDRVTFDLVIANTSDAPVDIEWAQPCMRVDGFTGKGKDDYMVNCFIFTESGPVMLNKTRRTEDAIYKGGQVYVPREINRDDVNPRPLSPDMPVNNLIGCISADGNWIVATAWDHTQELFQGIITCIHADFRIGGLAQKESKRVRGVVYVIPNDFKALLKRYAEDFPPSR
ncbi:MAG: hypothetical protein IT366_09645 [Candidatus Hydrogenedentes bacterium]|nr:hypothetical protein [Candidatus Hydrogenedentota bacterium]